MNFFEKLFGKFHMTTYHIDMYSETQEFLTKHDVFLTVNDTTIYVVGEGYLEVGSEYIANCKKIPKCDYEAIIQGKSIRNIHFVPSP